MKEIKLEDLTKLPTAKLLGKIKYGNLSQEENLAIIKVLDDREIDTEELKKEISNRKFQEKATPSKTSKFTVALFILLALSALHRFYKKMESEEKLKEATQSIQTIK